MKKIFFAVLALAGLAACSTDEVVSRPQGAAIGFDSFVDHTTRAAVDLTFSNLADFGVYGTVAKGTEKALIFTNTKVTKTDGVFTYSPVQYWVADATYTFTAFAPATAAQWAYTPADVKDAYNGVLSFDNAAAKGEQDLLFASAERTIGTITSTPDKVGFTFGHLLSKVAFNYKNNFTDGNITLNVYDVKVTNAAANGTINVANGVTGDWTATGDYLRTFGLADADASNLVANGGGNITTEHFYFIPAQREYNVQFKVDVIQAGILLATYQHNVTANINFEKGKSYSINAVLTPDNVNPNEQLYPIEFTVVKVEDWVNADVALEATTVATAAELVSAIAEGGEIRLTDDLNLDDIMVTRASTYGLFIENDCVIDGNGYTITTSASRGIAVSGANDVTLKNFELVASKAERGIQVQGGAKKVTIENVTAVSSNYTVNLPESAGATVVTINNCDLKGLNTINVAAPGSKVTVNNTTLRCEDNADEGYSVVCINKSGVGATVTVNGGEVIITGSNTGSTCGGSVEAIDATLTFNETKGNTTIRGYGFAIEYGDYYYSFPTFEAALAKALPGETIKLLKNVNLTEPIVITKKAIIDLNGKNITADTFLYPGNTVEEDSYAFWVKDGGDLTINGEGEISTASCPYSIAVWAQGGKVTINGGKFFNAGEGSDLIYASANGHVVINGGEFKACEKQAGVDGTLEAYSALNLKGDGTGSSITCYGGRFFKFNPADNKSENPAVSFVAPGKTVEVDGDWFVVK